MQPLFLVASKPLLAHAVPAALVVVSSVALWKLWQQHEKNKKNEGDINALKTQLEDIKAAQQKQKQKQKSTTDTTQQTIQAAKKTTATPPMQNTSSHSATGR